METDGTLWSWGNNGNGQLGTGNTTARSTPGTVSGITTAVAVAAGGSHALALLADGSVRAWGSNSSGQLGDGTVTQRTSPVSISSVSGVVRIAAGGSHSLALLSDGSVWAWGSNLNGQLGDGTTTSRSTPVLVGGLPPIASIAAGAYHSLAVTSDGTVWAWGRNTDGQLGDGTTTTRSSPTQIATAGMNWKIPAPVLSLASGTYFAVQTVTVTSGDGSATLHYTVNGLPPLEADPVVASGGTVAVNQSLTLKVQAWKPGAVSSEVVTGSYQLKAVAPVFSPATGYYATAQAISLTTTTPGASLTYTTDGTEPLATSKAYAGSISVGSTVTLKGRAFKSGWTPSASVASSYIVYAGTLDAPAITPAGGAMASSPLVAITATATGATIRYTLDGTEPTVASPRYAFPFLVERSATVKAKVFSPGYLPSATATATYVLEPSGVTATPVISPAGGLFTTRQTIAITGPATAQQELAEPMPAPLQILPRIIPRPRQVPNRLVLGRRRLHGGQQAGASQLHQLAAVTAIRLHPLPRFPGHQGRRDHVAVHTRGSQLSLQGIAARAGFIKDPHPTGRLSLNLLHEPPHGLRLVGDFPAHRRRLLGAHQHRDEQILLVRIDPDVRDNVLHDRLPSVRLWRAQALTRDAGGSDHRVECCEARQRYDGEPVIPILSNTSS